MTSPSYHHSIPFYPLIINILIASPGDRMAPGSTEASLELDAFTSRLEELGVRQCADVTFLNDEDLKQAHDLAVVDHG